VTVLSVTEICDFSKEKHVTVTFSSHFSEEKFDMIFFKKFDMSHVTLLMCDENTCGWIFTDSPFSKMTGNRFNEDFLELVVWLFLLDDCFEHIELPARLLDYFLRGNTSNINQSYRFMRWNHDCTLEA